MVVPYVEICAGCFPSCAAEHVTLVADTFACCESDRCADINDCAKLWVRSDVSKRVRVSAM